MKTTFNNSQSNTKESRKANKIEGLKHLRSRVTDFRFYMNHDTDKDNAENPEEWEKLNEKLTGGIGSFYDYGLSIDYVAPNTFERQRRGYFRYQLSWGGPSEEIRIYCDKGQRQPDLIEFVFMQWGTGVGFDVTNEDWAMWLFDWFEGSDTINYEREKAMNEECV
jgi:hypothetical protein